MAQVPARQMLEEALKDFRKALVQQGVYPADHQNLDRAYSGAKDLWISCWKARPSFESTGSGKTREASADGLRCDSGRDPSKRPSP